MGIPVPDDPEKVIAVMKERLLEEGDRLAKDLEGLRDNERVFDSGKSTAANAVLSGFGTLANFDPNRLRDDRYGEAIAEAIAELKAAFAGRNEVGSPYNNRIVRSALKVITTELAVEQGILEVAKIADKAQDRRDWADKATANSPFNFLRDPDVRLFGSRIVEGGRLRGWTGVTKKGASRNDTGTPGDL